MSASNLQLATLRWIFKSKSKITSKILVIDDDYSNAYGIQVVLENNAFNVWSICHSDDPIIMGIFRAKDDGGKMCNALNRISTNQHIPVLLTKTMPELRVNLLSTLATAIIFKPFDYVNEYKKVHLLTR